MAIKASWQYLELEIRFYFPSPVVWDGQLSKTAVSFEKKKGINGCCVGIISHFAGKKIIAQRRLKGVQVINLEPLGPA